MDIRLTAEQMSAALQTSLKENIWREEDTALIFYDLDFLKKRIAYIKGLFPAETLHAVAAKANPLPRVLQTLRPLGVGLEAATMSEAWLGQKCGYGADRIVYDSPAKTAEELRYALERGWHINADNFSELERIDHILKISPSQSAIGLRVNPRVGMGAIALTSVAGDYSKFGLPLDELGDEIIAAYGRYPWLNSIHVHVGSQGCSLEQLLNGTRKALDFAEKINKSVRRGEDAPAVRWFDMGGGMPAAYHPDEPRFTLEDYSAGLRRVCPELFEGRYRLITEFGRFVHANSGWTASRVEYVKRYGGKKTAVIHVGADLLMRRCYMPESWYHHLSVCDARGRLKTGRDKSPYTIAGPLCFNGDLIARDIELPPIEAGDFLLVHDTGAYTLSMWSRHTSRLIPAVWGYDGKNAFRLLKKRESLEDLYRFWR